MLLVNIFSIFIQKRLAVTVKGYTFALAFGKARPCEAVRSGSVTIERVH